jgi:hypothetical protein
MEPGNDEMGIALGIINLADIRYTAAKRQKNAAHGVSRGYLASKNHKPRRGERGVWVQRHFFRPFATDCNFADFIPTACAAGCTPSPPVG